jgi:hypothetical protein
MLQKHDPSPPVNRENKFCGIATGYLSIVVTREKVTFGYLNIFAEDEIFIHQYHVVCVYRVLNLLTFVVV